MSEDGGQGEEPSRAAGVARVGLLVGPALWLVLRVIDGPSSMPTAAWGALGVLLWMATWWITDAVPLALTALLPLILFPVFGVLSVSATAAPYANPVIFLFLGGFLLAKGIERSGLHRRMAYAILGTVGTSPSALIGGFMAATAFISMWVSNTATVMMIFPMAISIIALAERDAAATSPRCRTST